MTMTSVQQILANPSLVPWVEEAAFKYSMQRFVMASRVLVKTDMSGWNTRKISELLRPTGAKALSEGVEIPASKMHRKRLAEIAPSEWGDMYPITDRRIDTDPESVLSDVVTALGYSLGLRREQELFRVVLANAEHAFTYGTNYDIGHAIQAQTLFGGKNYDGEVFHVIHPYQELSIMSELLKMSNTAVPDFRNEFIRQWNFGGFGGLNIAVSNMTPRKVLSRLVFGSAPVAAETFRLRFGLKDTANIAIGANVAATVTNIKTALDALGFGAFTVTGTNYNNVRVQSPVFVDEEMQLELGRDDEGDIVNNVTGSIVIQEVSAVARAPFFERSGVIYDIRKALNVYQEWFPRRRTLEIGAYETYGVGAWRDERLGFIETNATAPNAVATP